MPNLRITADALAFLLDLPEGMTALTPDGEEEHVLPLSGEGVEDLPEEVAASYTITEDGQVTLEGFMDLSEADD